MEELEDMHKYNNQPMKHIIKKAEKKIDDKKKPIDPKYIFEGITMPKRKGNKKAYRKPDDKKNDLEFNTIEDMVFE